MASLIQERRGIKPNEEHNDKTLQGFIAVIKQHHRDFVKNVFELKSFF